MSRVAGYNPVSMPSVNFDVSSQYTSQALVQYQGNENFLPGRTGGMSYTPIEQEEYKLAPQRQYDFGSVRSPAIGAILPQRSPRTKRDTGANIDDLPIIKQASAPPTPAFTYHGITIGSDYSLVAASVHQMNFETEKQNLARTVLTELERLEDRQTLLQMN